MASDTVQAPKLTRNQPNQWESLIGKRPYRIQKTYSDLWNTLNQNHIAIIMELCNAKAPASILAERSTGKLSQLVF